ncbi:MAG: ATP-grasp domain-containing protein [Bacteroidia bacterium]|nr:MAG: ATP-grasp domain-containing protein [Bacteroidia bacterium]
MFLIDKPYVSDFLIETIRVNNYKIVSTREAKELIPDNSLNWIGEEEAIRNIESDPHSAVYISSENSMTWIARNLSSSKLLSKVHLFKDKARFRELIKSSFPGFFFKTVKLADIQYLNPEEIGFPFVIKPSLGFFSMGVHIIHNLDDWEVAKNDLSPDSLQNIYPEEVFNGSIFIIEEYIGGEEYAVDCYFNSWGEAVITNILHHRFSSGKDISHRVYSTSKDIIFKYKDDIERFLVTIGDKAGLKNFAAHVEIRIDANGSIRPIEVNPLRFGGWCTTGDLSWYAFGINPYEYYVNNQKPDWEQIFTSRENKIYSIVVLNNNSGYQAQDITGFNYELLAGDFENALLVRRLDVKEHTVFGFLFTETSLDNQEELDRILVSDLRKYISVQLS